jgi:hypothetical protein
MCWLGVKGKQERTDRHSCTNDAHRQLPNYAFPELPQRRLPAVTTLEGRVGSRTGTGNIANATLTGVASDSACMRRPGRDPRN